MKKAIIFDLNGVFIITPRLSKRFNIDFGVEIDDFMPVLQEVMGKVRLPNAVGIYSLWKPYLDKWNINLPEEDFFSYWFNAESENLEFTSLAAKLKQKGYKLIILSNNFSERTKYYAENFQFLKDLFEAVYYSWQTGFVKPDVRAFELILKNHDLKPEDCLYFDDSEKNVDLATSIGMKSYIFDANSVEILRLLL